MAPFIGSEALREGSAAESGGWDVGFYTRLTSIPRSRKGAMALSVARVSVISVCMSEIGQTKAGVTAPSLVESATTILMWA
jgi:hypothetical protein